MNTPTPFETDEHQLAERIRGFTHDDASPAEQAVLCNMLKELAEKTVERWELVIALEKELNDKLSMANIREKMSEVLVITQEGNERGVRRALGGSALDGYQEIEKPFWRRLLELARPIGDC